MGTVKSRAIRHLHTPRPAGARRPSPRPSDGASRSILLHGPGPPYSHGPVLAVDQTRPTAPTVDHRVGITIAEGGFGRPAERRALRRTRDSPRPRRRTRRRGSTRDTTSRGTGASRGSPRSGRP